MEKRCRRAGERGSPSKIISSEKFFIIFICLGDGGTASHFIGYKIADKLYFSGLLILRVIQQKSDVIEKYIIERREGLLIHSILVIMLD